MTPKVSKQPQSLHQPELFSAANTELAQNEEQEEWRRRRLEQLAKELQRTLDEVELFYEEAMQELEARAQVRDYLSIFIEKRVKRALKIGPRRV